MSETPFQIRLRESPADVPIAEFPARTHSDCRRVSRRARVFAALAGLPSKRRSCLARLAAETCRLFSSCHLAGTVRFALKTRNHETDLIVEVAADDGDDLKGIAADDIDSLRSQCAGAEGIAMEEHRDRIAFRTTTPTIIRLPPEAPRQWAELIAVDSMEEAIAMAQNARQQSNSELGIARAFGPSEEATQKAAADRDDLETLSLVASQTPIAISVMDASGAIQWTNQAFERLTGYCQAEVIGQRLDELLFGPSTAVEAVREFAQALRHGHELSQDVMQYQRDGRTSWVELRMIPVPDSNGHVARWIGIQIDVTQRRQTEDALKAAKQSAEMNSRAKSEFLANMSHEIRTPLNAVVGMTELALATKLDSEQRDYLNCVQSSADTLLDLLNDVLDVSKIEAGKLEIENVTFNLAELVRETLKALAVKAHEKGLELAVHMPMDLPQYLAGDPTRIRQILFNLVGNAIKFTDSGEVVVDVDEQWTTDDATCLHFSVRDTGIGIPKDRLQQIFESFTQVDSSMARRFGGTGLGLTITSELVRMMDGKLWVQSKLGEGSAFHFTIQLGLADPPEAAPTPIDADELIGKTALVVDDNATNRRILEEMLRHWHIEPTLVDGAEAALHELKRGAPTGKPFDLVLLDAMMPRVNGFELAEAINSRPEIDCGTVMMLSSADRPNSTARCRHLGIETYLVKPVSASSLLDAIMSSFAGKKSMQSEVDSKRDAGGPLTSETPDRELKVLVVDDHEPNRRLAISILTRRGHRCESACDGDQAIAAVSRSDFDVVLMDVQMPGSDGFKATEAIRRREANTGTHLPIIALTAHALSGDRERCLAAGMDDYLPKPIHARELIAVVENVTGKSPNGDATSEVAKSQRKSDFDISAALHRMNGEQDLLTEHIGYVVNDAPQLLNAMRDAIASHDGRALEIAAHRLKSLVSAYSFESARELAYALELMGRDSELEEATKTLKQLCDQVDRFIPAIQTYAEAQA